MNDPIVFDGCLGEWRETSRGEYVFLPASVADADPELGELEDDTHV